MRINEIKHLMKNRERERKKKEEEKEKNQRVIE
jgi:hypothetical protein